MSLNEDTGMIYGLFKACHAFLNWFHIFQAAISFHSFYLSIKINVQMLETGQRWLWHHSGHLVITTCSSKQRLLRNGFLLCKEALISDIWLLDRNLSNTGSYKNSQWSFSQLLGLLAACPLGLIFVLFFWTTEHTNPMLSAADSRKRGLLWG